MRLMIAEDEKMTRESLRKLIPWSSMGIDEVVLACDGKNALDLASRNTPDILLTDVRMPVMDGIELAHYFVRLYPRCKVLFLSGYSEKEYLVNAIRLKASAFIEKPIDLEEVAAAVSAAVQEVRDEWSRERQDAERASLLGTSFLWNLLSGNLTQAAHDACKMDEIHASVSGSSVSDHWSSTSTHWSAVSIHVLNLKEREALYEVTRLQNEKKMACTCVSDAYIHIITTDVNNSTEARVLDSARQAGIRVNIGTAVCTGGLEEASRTVNDSVRAAQNAFFFGRDVVEAKEICERTTEGPNLPIGPLAHPDETADTIAKVCERFCEDGFWPISTARDRLYRMADALVKDAQFHQISPLPLSAEASELWYWVNRYSTLAEAETGLLTALQSLAGAEAGSAHIREAMRYIEDNLENHNLSLSGMADHLKLNTSYLSTLFKEKTNRTFVTFITEKRMARARVLLDDRHAKTQDIARKVGYADPAWFIKRFKQAFGMTPNEYKEKCCR